MLLKFSCPFVNNNIFAEAVVVPGREAELSFRTTGEVLELLVEEGVQVEAGQAIARLDSADADVALAQADAAVAQAEAGVTSAEAGVESARAGVESAQAQLASAEVSVEAAKAQTASIAQSTLQPVRARRQRQQIAMVQSEKR